MTRLPKFAPDRLDSAQRELYDSIATGPRARGPQAFRLTDDDGCLEGPFNAMLLAPGVSGALQALGAAARYGVSLTPRAREIVILVVAHQWRCDFEIYAHEAVGTSVGLRPDELELLRQGRVADLADPVERRIALTARDLVARGDLDDEAFAAARDELGEAMIFELTTITGYYAMLALQLRVFRVARP